MEKTMNIFLLRGLVREGEHWCDFTPTLKQAFPEANIFALDIPGAGIYNHLPTPLSIPKIVEQVRQDYLRITQSGSFKNLPNYIISVSLGGMLTFEWLTKHTNDFKKAVIINTSLKGINPIWHRMYPKNIPTLLKIANTKDVYEKEALVLSLVLNNEKAFDSIHAEWVKIQEKRPVSTFNAVRQLWAATSYSPPKHKPKTPVLLIVGAKDRLVSPKCSEKISKHWHLPLVTHPWGGHDLSGDDPEWLAQEVKKWF